MSRSLDDVKNEEWLIEVGLAMGEKERVLERYMNYPEEKVSHAILCTAPNMHTCQCDKPLPCTTKDVQYLSDARYVCHEFKCGHACIYTQRETSLHAVMNAFAHRCEQVCCSHKLICVIPCIYVSPSC